MRFSIQMLGEEGVVQVKQAQRESFRMIVMPNYRPGTRSQNLGSHNTSLLPFQYRRRRFRCGEFSLLVL